MKSDLVLPHEAQGQEKPKFLHSSFFMFELSSWAPICAESCTVQRDSLWIDNVVFRQENNMAARPTWKGYLKISLVNIPVRVFPATDSAAIISFNQLHAECRTRIQQKKWCPTCEKEVTQQELVKGYEFE